MSEFSQATETEQLPCVQLAAYIKWIGTNNQKSLL